MKRLLATIAIALGALAGSPGALAADAPTYPGGADAMQQFIAQTLRYPAPALQNGIEGNVTLQFIVKTDGTITSIKVTRMIDPDLEAEAIRIVKAMPAWIPADKEGAPVEATATVTIPFRLPE